MTNDVMYANRLFLVQNNIPSPLTVPSDEDFTTIGSLTPHDESPYQNSDKNSYQEDSDSDSTIIINYSPIPFDLKLSSHSEMAQYDEEVIEPSFGLFHSTRIPFKAIGTLYIMGLTFGILNSIPKTQNENFTLMSVLLNGIASMLVLTKLCLKRQEEQVELQRTIRSPV